MTDNRSRDSAEGPECAIQSARAPFQISVHPDDAFDDLADLDPTFPIELGGGAQLVPFEPPSVRMHGLRVIGIRSERRTTFLVLWDPEGGRLIDLNLASPRRVAAQLARYFGDRFPPAFLHAYVMKLARRMRDLRDFKKVQDGVTVVEDDRPIIVTGSATISVQVRDGRPYFQAEPLPLVDDFYLADPRREDWLGFTAVELNKPPLYNPADAFYHVFNIVNCFE